MRKDRKIMLASTYDNTLVPVASTVQARPVQQQPHSPHVLNNFANEYLTTVRENRSKFGSFVDNQLSCDPFKEQKSVYNVVYDCDTYNPWGKPGAGAPKLDGNSGQLTTKIAGHLRWNISEQSNFFLFRYDMVFVWIHF